MSQLALPLAVPPRFGPEDFLISGSNAAAHAAVERWPDWPDPVLLLVGPPGSGKTHLAHLWAERARSVRLTAEDLTQDLPAVATRAGVIDGADGQALPEAGLFHLLNLVREGGSSLLITARTPPERWALTTPDLLSRLRLASRVEIEPPDDALVRAVLVKLFGDRQIRVEAGLIDHLAVRLDRSLAAVGSAVEALDAAGLSRGRPITRSLASEILRGLQLDAE